MNRLEELLLLSRDWSKQRRGSHVVEAAIEFLRKNFQVEAGFFEYNRASAAVEHLGGAHRWLTSWGFKPANEELSSVLMDAEQLDMNFHNHEWVDVNSLSDSWRDLFAQAGLKQAGAWTMSFDDETAGVFILGRKSSYADDSGVMSLCMAHISVLLELVLQRRISEEVAMRDPLTGMYNRRGFLREFSRLVESQEGPFTLAVLDIDEFKKTNDEYGHQAGDSVLVQVAQILKHQAQRYQGVCGRLGGDEFIVLGRIEIVDADRVANVISGWFTDLDIKVSAGCVTLGAATTDFDIAYHIADERLYDRKSLTYDNRI